MRTASEKKVNTIHTLAKRTTPFIYWVGYVELALAFHSSGPFLALLSVPPLNQESTGCEQNTPYNPPSSLEISTFLRKQDSVAEAYYGHMVAPTLQPQSCPRIRLSKCREEPRRPPG